MSISDSVSTPDTSPVQGLLHGGGEYSLGDAGSVARMLEPVSADLPVSRFLERLQEEKGGPRVYPVVRGGRPLGVLDRLQFLETMNSPYARDLFGRRPVTDFVIAEIPRYEAESRLEEVIRSLTCGIDPLRSTRGNDCFLVVRRGEYAGVGFVLDLLGRIHEHQLELARQANPLTGLPGNSPIEHRIWDLLQGKDGFQLAYCDLDNFKAFNDRYGYARGDAMILLVARILSEMLLGGRGLEAGFVGHVGGDDFVVLAPWDVHEGIWQEILDAFAKEVPSLYDDADRLSGGVAGKDRRGREIFHPLATLSIGVLPCPVGRFSDPRQVAQVAAEIKLLAKKIEGNSWFQERREFRESGAEG
jgi:GGDEF domain-containing protein